MVCYHWTKVSSDSVWLGVAGQAILFVLLPLEMLTPSLSCSFVIADSRRTKRPFVTLPRVSVATPKASTFPVSFTKIPMTFKYSNSAQKQ